MSTATAARTPESVLRSEPIISADSHVMEPTDLWEKNLPPNLESKYPKFPSAQFARRKTGRTGPRARIDEMEVDGVS